MQSRIRKNNKQKKPKGGRRGGRVLGGSSVRVNHAYMEKSIFPQMPQEFEVALSYYYHDERTGGQTTQAARIYPLLEFNTQLPRYAAELYQIYRHARIMAIDVKMEVVNTSSTEPLIAAIGVLPLVNANAITNPQTIVSVPGSILKQIGLSTGLSKVTLNKRFISEKWLGELSIGSNTYLQTYSEALSAAIWTELPAVYAGVIAARNGATWTGIIDYRLIFHLRWSEYNIPSLGLAEPKLPLKRLPPSKSTYSSSMVEEESEEVAEQEEEWVQPKLTKQRKFIGNVNKR